MSASWIGGSRWLVFATLVASLVTVAVAAHDEKKAPTMVEGWGTVTNSLGDCTVKAAGENGNQKLIVTVPGGNHDLNPIAGGMNAPRILQSVEGDFSIQVKVTGEFDPGEKAGGFALSPFNGAGLLIWQDQRNYIRLERNIYWERESMVYACYPPLVEQYRYGIYQGTNPQPTWATFFEGNSTWLRFERKGDTVTASFSQDGKTWKQAKQIEAKFPKQVSVGVAAVNTSVKEFIVEFDELKIVTK